MNNYLAIAIGNTRIKAVVFGNDRQIVEEYVCMQAELSNLESQIGDRDFAHIAIASVVPNLITRWHGLPQTQIMKTSDVPIQGFYLTMGCDRALAAFGAAETYGYPVLVIDAGTAITVTGIDADKKFGGGAIVAGLRSQFSSLHQNTSALPNLEIPDSLPTRWGNDTNSSIQAGITHMLLAGLRVYIDDWRSRFPDSKIIVTGGDGEHLAKWGLEVDIIDRYLIFLGALAFHEFQSQALSE
jgi:type III pantothenate kinase